MALRPYALAADSQGNIRENRSLLMLCARGGRWFLPEPDELEPLPPESELFMLPGRQMVGFDKTTGQPARGKGMAVAAFAAPAHTIAAHPAWIAEADAPALPLFAYAAAGYARGRLWICAKKTDRDLRQRFEGVDPGLIAARASRLLAEFPENRLVGHIIDNCVRKYDCPAARNFALGRFEAPLPTSRSCNARCLGCISKLQAGSPFAQTPQCRLDFIPLPAEVAEVMRIHQSRERRAPIYSFGQGCEGDPLANAGLLAESISLFRAEGGKGTINCNTNASKPEAVAEIAEAGLTSLRVSLNSARPEIYHAYYRTVDYEFANVRESIRAARARGVFTSLNLLYFPGLTDTPAELEALAGLCAEDGVEMIQWRNLNIDPDWLWRELEKAVPGLAKKGEGMGPGRLMAELRKKCPWLKYGYFNPYLGDKAKLSAPGQA